MVDVNRLKKDGKTKYVKLLGKGILTLVDHLFWNLPFCSVKQSQAVRKKAGVTEEERSTKWDGAGEGGAVHGGHRPAGGAVPGQRAHLSRLQWPVAAGPLRGPGRLRVRRGRRRRLPRERGARPTRCS